MITSDKTLQDLGWSSLIEALASRAHTVAGERLLRELRPLGSVDEARQRIAEIAEARFLTSVGEAMPFSGVEDVESHVDRAARGGTLEPETLVAIAETLLAAGRLRKHLSARRESCPLLWARAARLDELSHVSGPIRDSFDDKRRIRDDASPALAGLRRRAAALREEMRSTLERLVASPEIAPALQDRYFTQREGRFVLPVRSDRKQALRGIVHGMSGSGATLFVEPEPVVHLNNALTIAELEVREEEQRILRELSGLVRDNADIVSATLHVLADLDLIDAAARLADDLDAAAPELGGDAVALEMARHPLIVLSGRECVPNHIAVKKGGVLVISGPNAGGKTVALKTCGLLVLMAAAGLHIPARTGSTVPVFQAVLTDVSDEQSLERDLSTFSAHLINLKTFLEHAREGVLVLIDEIAVGTDPAQGAALGEAVLSALADRGATVVVTTHYDRLKTLATRDSRFVNASVGFDMEALTPTFRLHMGVPGSSLALALARRLGLDQEVIARATKLLGEGDAGLDELLRSLADEKRRLEEEEASLARVRKELAKALDEAEMRAQRYQMLEHELRVRAHEGAMRALHEARDTLKAARAMLRKGVTSASVAHAEEMIERATQTIAQEAPKAPRPEGRPARPEDLVPGTRVFVPRLGSKGKVLSAPERGRVAVQLGSLRTQVEVGDVWIGDAGGVVGVGKTAAADGPRVHVRSNRRGNRSAAEGKAEGASGSQPGGRKEQGASGTQPGGRKEQGASGSQPAARLGGGAHPGAGAGGASGDPAAVPPNPGFVASAPSLRTPEVTLDLRGERVDDAIRLAEQFLDRALREDREVVFLLHGHGTGALKQALRQHLATYPLVRSLRPGTQEEGGDGVTVVELG